MQVLLTRRIMEKNMETIGIIGVILGLYRDYIGIIFGIMEKKMETSIMGYTGITRHI